LLGACDGQTILGNAAAGAAGVAGQAVAIEPGGGDTATEDPSGGTGGVELGGKGGVSAGGRSDPGGGTPSQPLAKVDAQRKADKLDVLFVVDNSLRMAQAQSILGHSVAAFVSRLLNPRCMDAQGEPAATQPESGAAACPVGEREFSPVTDLHIAAITNSLGAHGGIVCATPTGPDDHLDDKAQLLPSVRTGIESYQDSGFLSFNASGNAGITDPSVISNQLSALVNAAGEHGCGYEATLESMYRFLIDPEPPQSVDLLNNVSTPGATNQTLLAQRAAFLRPDSSVAIVILSDENDCSIVDFGVGWFVGSSNRMPRATPACEVDANDPCCRSCAQVEDAPPSGCAPLAESCGSPAPGQQYAVWDMLHDSLNLRCFDQRRRFGFDLLNPLDRYSVGLTNPSVYDRGGALVPNPLFAARAGKGARSNSLISLSVIVGAPWQDLATSDSLTSDKLSFLSAPDLESAGRFQPLIGTGEYGKPTDPLMRESIDVRSGKNPLTNEFLVAASSTNPLANSSNGHEQNIPQLDDLQYACTFPLPVPVACQAGDPSCECSADKGGNASAVIAANSPLCQPPSGGPPETTQYFGKGYPGLRQLRVARALGARAAYGSICPKQTSDSSSQTYGYVPALNALIDRIAVTLK
jgi:hypothetical protein